MGQKDVFNSMDIFTGDCWLAASSIGSAKVKKRVLRRVLE